MKERIAAIRQEIKQTLDQEMPLSAAIFIVLGTLLASGVGIAGAFLLGGLIWPL
jgi:hypothetical protein